jgi:hypothetical protein
MPSLVDYDCDHCGADLTPVLDESNARCPGCGAELSPLKLRATALDFYGQVYAGVSVLLTIAIGIAGYRFVEWIPWVSELAFSERIVVVVMTAIVAGFVSFAAMFGFAVYSITGSVGSVGTMLVNLWMLAGLVIGVGLCCSGVMLWMGMENVVLGLVLIGLILLQLFTRRRRPRWW